MIASLFVHTVSQIHRLSMGNLYLRSERVVGNEEINKNGLERSSRLLFLFVKVTSRTLQNLFQVYQTIPCLSYLNWQFVIPWNIRTRFASGNELSAASTRRDPLAFDNGTWMFDRNTCR